MFDPHFHNEGQNVFQLVEKWIRWIPLINGRFKLNFDDSRVENRCASRWVIRESNESIKMVVYKHLGNTPIIIVECMALKEGILVVKYNGFLSLQI